MNKFFIIFFSLILFLSPSYAEQLESEDMPKSQYETNLELAEKMPPIKLSKRDLKKLETKGITKEIINIHVNSERAKGRSNKEIRKDFKKLIADINRENRHIFFNKVITFFKRLFLKLGFL